jgi:hypothetical protein
MRLRLRCGGSDQLKSSLLNRRLSFSTCCQSVKFDPVGGIEIASSFSLLRLRG